MKVDGYTLVDINLAYIADFFDGEGYIGVRSRQTYPELVIEVGNKDKPPIQFIADIFGGTVHEKPPSRGRCLFYKYQRQGYPAAEILEKLLPYLICKKERALLGLTVIGATSQQKNEIADKMARLNAIHGKGKADVSKASRTS